VDCIKDSLKRFATGTYLIWYPRLQRPEPQLMLDKLRSLNTDYLHICLDVQQASADGFGMHGSGMWVINPPWTLRQSVEPQLDWLSQTLAQDAHARAWCEGQQR
jgi:23S rRNA (adenine2030-N6)-methyltransferase